MPPEQEYVYGKVSQDFKDALNTQRKPERIYNRDIDLGKIDCEKCSVEEPLHKSLRGYRCPHRETNIHTEDVRRLSFKKAYRLVANYLCTPSASLLSSDSPFLFPEDPTFKYKKELSHLLENPAHGLTWISSFDDHEPYELTEEELGIFDSSSSRLPASKETINPNHQKRMQSINVASRHLLRDQYLPLAHRVKAMVTIKANRKRHYFDDSSGNERSKCIPSNVETKSYLDSKLRDLYIALSELNNNKPFRLISNDTSANFIAFYHDVRKSRQSGKIIPCSPHYHILVLDDASALTDGKTLAPLLQRLSGKSDEEFDLPTIHLDFPTGGQAHHEHRSDLGLDCSEVIPLRTQRIKMIRYGTKYMWRNVAEDDGWKVVRSEAFAKKYPAYAFVPEGVVETLTIRNLKMDRRKKNRNKKKSKTRLRSLVRYEPSPPSAGVVFENLPAFDPDGIYPMFFLPIWNPTKTGIDVEVIKKFQL